MPRKSVTYRADIVQAMTLGMGETQIQLDDPGYGWRFLAEGDSWFTIGAIPSSSLLYEMRLKKRTVILNLGYPGDTISNIAQLSANTEFSRRLAHPNWVSNWDAILMSGGGNDLIDRAADIIREPPSGSSGNKAADYIDVDQLKAFRDAVQEGFRKIVALRGKIAERRLDGLATALLDLELELPAFHVADTRKLLIRANIDAKGNSGDWLNEIHPNSDGYRKIADVLAGRIHQLL